MEFLSPNTIAFSFAELGAMGCPGKLIAIMDNAQILEWEYGHWDTEQLHTFCPNLDNWFITRDIETPQGWTHVYLGCGNHLFVREFIYPQFKTIALAKNITAVNLYQSWMDIVKTIVKHLSTPNL